MGLIDSIYRKNISSPRLGRQIVGALIQWRPKHFLAFVLLITPLSVGISMLLSPGELSPMLHLFGLNLVMWLIVKVCKSLTNTFSLNRNENGITGCQIIILTAIGMWIIGFALIFNVQTNAKVASAIGIIGVVMSWIFQDRIKGVAAFLHFRMHHLLNIGDWIQVPSREVDGQVKRVTLTSVTLYNWDTTTSTIPISILQSEHFINLQSMAEGRTYGRLMRKVFVFDTCWIRTITETEAKKLRSAANDVSKYLPADEIKAGALNARLYRLYLYHWLMNNPYVSQQPRLMVRWREPKESGMALELYLFLTDSDIPLFEWRQSQIIEHVSTSMQWFGMKLYQRPSSYAVSNANVRLAGKAHRSVEEETGQ